MSVVDLIDGQRHAVERDRALGGDETHQLSRRAQRQPRHVGQVFARDKLGDAVDVTGDDMPAELVAHLQRAFEIEPGALLPGAAVVMPRSRRRHRRRTRCGRPLAGFDHRQADAGMAIEAPIGDEARVVARRRSSAGAMAFRARLTAITSPISVTMPVNIHVRSKMVERVAPDLSLADRSASAISSARSAAMPSSASMPSRRSPWRAKQRRLVDQIGLDECRRDGRPALHHQPRDAAFAQRLEHRSKIEPRRPWPRRGTPRALRLQDVLGDRRAAGARKHPGRRVTRGATSGVAAARAAWRRA